MFREQLFYNVVAKSYATYPDFTPDSPNASIPISCTTESAVAAAAAGLRLSAVQLTKCPIQSVVKRIGTLRTI